MGLPEPTLGQQDMQRFIQDIAEIFFSDEFNSLRQELENLYCTSDVKDAFLTAFQDALFAILAQHDTVISIPKSCGK